MSKSQKTIVAPPAPAVSEPVAPDTALAVMEHEFEVLTGPDMSGIQERIQAVLETINTKRTQVQQFLLRKQVDIAYDLVEIGWVLLQGKASVDHGMTGQRNAAPDKSDTDQTVSLSGLESGFLGWVETTFASLNKRTAQRYMNAARNLKLTHESTLEQVRALREMSALEGKRLTDLYLPPQGEGEIVDAEQDAEEARARAETQRFEESLLNLNQLGLEKRVFCTLPKPRLKAIDGQLLELRRAVAEAMKA